MTTSEQLAAIRAQIVVELKSLEAEQSAERITLQAAEAAHAEAKAAWAALQELAAGSLVEG